MVIEIVPEEDMKNDPKCPKCNSTDIFIISNDELEREITYQCHDCINRFKEGEKIMEEDKEEDDVRLIIVERCIDLPKKLATFGVRVSKCEECKQDVWVSKASDSYMNKHSDEKMKIMCKHCWKAMDKEEDEDRDFITTEETLKEFDEWYLTHYGYKPTREQTFEMMEHYIGKRPKITK